MKFRENEEAVSPVIGVILMVAITVILAAVIAAFVFGMAGNVDTKNKMVAATASAMINDSGKYVYITYQGGVDAKLVENVTYTFNENTAPVEICTGAVGAVKVEQGLKGSKDHVVVTANFKDGSSQVILDSFV